MADRIASRVPGPLLAALFLAAVAHLPALRAGYVQDDHAIVETSPIVARGSPSEIATSSWWAGFPLDDRALWRPLTIATFAIERAASGGGPSPRLAHAVNLALHLVACALLYAFARTMGAGPLAAAGAAALFGTLPARSEAVFSVVARADLLAGALTLAAAVAWRRASSPLAPWLAGLCAAAAACSKESGLAAIGLLVAVEALPGSPRRSWRSWIPVLALVAAVVGFRTYALEGFFPAPNLPPMDNPIPHLAGAPRLATALAAVWRYAALIIWPMALANDYSGPSLAVESGLAAPRALAGGAILLGAVALAVVPLLTGAGRPWLRPSAAGAALFVVPYLVVGNLLAPIGVAMAERLIYLPSAGLCVVAGVAAGALRSRKLAAALLAAAAAAGGARTFARGLDWKDDRTLFAATRRANPESPRAWYALARLDADAIADPVSDRRAVADAIAGFDRAIGLWDDYPHAWHAKGLLLARRGDLAAAEPCLRGAVARGPAFAEAWSDLGLALTRRGARDEAKRAFRKAVLFDPSLDKSWASLGHIAFEAGRFAEARRAYQRAVALGRRDLLPRLEESRGR